MSGYFRGTTMMSASRPLVVLGIALGAVLMVACATSGKGTPEKARPVLAVVSKGLPGVVIFDAATDREICRVKLGVAPHEAAFSADGRQLFVPIYSSANIGQPGPDGRSIVFLRTADCAIEAELDTGKYLRPHYVERGRSGLLYVTAEQDQAILVVDPGKRTIVDSIPTGSSNTHFFVLSPDEQRIYTSNIADRTLSVLDVPGRRLLRTVDAGASNQRMTLSPEGRLYVTNLWQSGKVAFYRTADDQLDFHVAIEGAPFVSRFSPDGRWLYNMGIAPQGSQPAGIRVWRIDTATRAVAAASSDALGVGTGSLQVSPVNGQVYLTAYSGQVSVLDPLTLKLLRQFPAADTPDGLFFSPLR
jgi:DNA-binding beta-propeller fold protein YncE